MGIGSALSFMSSKSLSGSQLRKFRSDVAKLKAKGLVSKRVDARSQQPTRHMLAQIKKFAPVLQGKASVVTVKKSNGKSASDIAKAYEGQFARKGRRLVVPVVKGETARFDARSGQVKRLGKTAKGERYVSTITPSMGAQASDFPKGDNIYYRIPMGRHGFFTVDSLEELMRILYEYENKPTNPYHGIKAHVQVIRVGKRGTLANA